MSSPEMFLWGLAGSASVEIVALLRYYSLNRPRLPERYHQPGFWVTRLALACLAGVLAVGYDIQGRILAFHIGAATPLIITSLARGLREPLEERAGLPHGPPGARPS
jgi:hypothetical protein